MGWGGAGVGQGGVVATTVGARPGTAGRGTTRRAGRGEGMASRARRLKCRTRKPSKGGLVAVSLSELLDASGAQIQQTARNVRARIDEVHRTLKMSVPVYVMYQQGRAPVVLSEVLGVEEVRSAIANL